MLSSLLLSKQTPGAHLMNVVEVAVIILNWPIFLVHDALQLNPDVMFKGLIAYWTGRQIFMYLY
jgi:hypothetical protein